MSPECFKEIFKYITILKVTGSNWEHSDQKGCRSPYYICLIIFPLFEGFSCIFPDTKRTQGKTWSLISLHLLNHSLNYALFLSYYIINTNLKDLDLRKLYNLEWYELINVVKFYNCKEWFNKCCKKKQYYSVFLEEHRNPRVFSNFALHLFYPKFMKDCVTLTWLSVRFITNCTTMTS